MESLAKVVPKGRCTDRVYCFPLVYVSYCVIEVLSMDQTSWGANGM